MGKEVPENLHLRSPNYQRLDQGRVGGTSTETFPPGGASGWGDWLRKPRNGCVRIHVSGRARHSFLWFVAVGF